MADIDYKQLAEEMAKANAKYAGKSSGPTGTKSTGVSAVDIGVDTFKKAIDPFGSAIGMAGKGVSALTEAVNSGVDTWRDLSKSGAGFNNDIIGMTVAAAGTRLPLREFAGVIKDNTDILGQLGGSVTRGAESFAKMSKSFFESGATDSLKQLGYTNKDLNEILALQAVTLRGKFRDDQQRDAVAIESASKLAEEMDLMAKLTGKSREAQMEQMKKNQMDMAFEASIRLKTQGMNAEEAAKFEANARMQLKDAQMRGQGDMFKEVFATGNVMSKDAAMQAALNQEQSEATMRQARATAAGDEKAASAANRDAQRAAVADMNNTSKLQQMQLGAAGGTASKVLNDMAGATITTTRSLEAIAKQNNLDISNPKDLAKAQEIQDKEAKKAQSGQDKSGDQVDGATKAAVALENTTDKVRAGLTTGLLEPLNKEVGPKLGEFAKTLDSLNKNYGGSGKDTSRAIEDSTKKGFAQGVSDKTPDRFQRQPSGSPLLSIPENIGGVAGGTAHLAGKGIDTVTDMMKPKQRQGGSLDMTGGLFENWGKGEMVELHGMEGVMRPQDIEKIVETSLGGAKKSMSDIKTPNMATGGGIGGGGIDLSSITKNLNTSFSSITSGIKMPDMKEMSMPFNTAFKDFNLSFSSIAKDGAEKIAKTPIPTEPFDEFGSNFDDVVAKMSKNIGTAVPYDTFDEFGSNFDDVVAKMSKNIGTAVPYDTFDEFGSNFDDVVAKMAADVSNAMPLDAMDQNAAALEYATKRREELEQIMNDGQARSSKEWDEIFDEAEQLDGQIDKLVTKQIEAMTNYSDGWDETGDMMDKVNTDIVEAVGGSKSKIAQDKIDAAIEEKKKANETLAFMLNNIADEDWDDEAQAAWDQAIDRRDAAKEKLDKVIEESIGDLAEGFDEFGDGWNDSVDKITADIADSLPVDTEFGDLDGAIAKNQQDDEARAEMDRESRRGSRGAVMQDLVANTAPTATQSRGITMDSFTLGPNGMPIAKPKSTSAAAPEKKKDENESDAETARLKRQNDAKKEDEKGSAGEKKGGTETKAATLDDVVKSLNALNTKMGQLITVSEDGHKSTAKAAKSGSANLYNK